MTAARKLWSVADDDGEGGGNVFLKRAIVDNDEVNVTPRMFIELEVWDDHDGGRAIAKRSMTIAQTERLIAALQGSVALMKEGKGFV